MSSPTDLKIAEMLFPPDENKKKTYREIQKALHVSPDTIRKVREACTQGIIVIGDDGKAFLAKPAQKEIEEIHTEVMDVVTRKATELALRNAEEDYAIGNEIRQYWSLKAQERGLDLRQYVKTALNFHDDFKDEVENMKEQIDVARIVMDAYKRDIVKSTKLELYYKFVRYCLYLRQQGMRITQEVVDAFWRDLTLMETGEELKIITGGHDIV